MNRRDFLRGVASCAVAVAAPLPPLNPMLVFAGVDLARATDYSSVVWRTAGVSLVSAYMYSDRAILAMDFREAEERVMAYLGDPGVPHEEKADLLRVEFSPTGRLLVS